MGISWLSAVWGWLSRGQTLSLSQCMYVFFHPEHHSTGVSGFASPLHAMAHQVSAFATLAAGGPLVQPQHCQGQSQSQRGLPEGVDAGNVVHMELSP